MQQIRNGMIRFRAKRTAGAFLFSILGLVLSLQTGILPRFATAADVLAEGVVGFAQDTLDNDWRVAQVHELRRAFSRHPEIRFFYTDAAGETARQIRDVEDMIHMKVDVLITSPRDSRAMTPVIARAYHRGIPVILISRRIETDDFTSFIHPDNRAIARKAALYIVNRLNGQGNILILQHIPTTTPAIQRTEGFLEVIRKHPRMKVVGMKVANSLRADAIQMTEEAIREGLKFDAVYAQSDSMAAGARLALKKAGIDPRKIVIVGIDYISEAREAIRAGEQDASFTYPTGGEVGARFTVNILRNEPVPKEFVIESVMVTAENVENVAPIF